MALTRNQLRKKAQRLREQGKTYLQIAVACGTTPSTVYRWLNPAAAEKDRQRRREWKAQHKNHIREYDAAYQARPETRAPCPRCGGSLHASKGDMRNVHVCCADCKQRELDERDRELERLWSQGAQCHEIMERFGWSKGHVQQEMFRARNRGANLPYRRIDGRTHPELRKAA